MKEKGTKSVKMELTKESDMTEATEHAHVTEIIQQLSFSDLFHLA